MVKDKKNRMRSCLIRNLKGKKKENSGKVIFRERMIQTFP